MTLINDNINVICYYSKDIVPPFSWYISQNYYNTMSPLHIPMKEYDNEINENDRRESI